MVDDCADAGGFAGAAPPVFGAVLFDWGPAVCGEELFPGGAVGEVVPWADVVSPDVGCPTFPFWDCWVPGWCGWFLFGECVDQPCGWVGGVTFNPPGVWESAVGVY